MTDNESECIIELMNTLCRKCNNSQCSYPCDKAKDILKKYNLEYKG